MKGKRGPIAVNALILLLFPGLVYAWSVFKKPLALQYGWNDGQLTWAFTACMSFFCIGGFVGARLSGRFRPATLIRACGVIIGAGFACAAFVSRLWQLYLTYGLVIGGCAGIVYNVVIAAVTRWFPDRPGFISGLLLMAFGFGSLVFGPLATVALESIGWRHTMLLLGGLFVLVFFLTGFRIRLPEEAENIQKPAAGNSADGLSPSQMLRERSFRIYLTWCVLVCAAGLALVGQASTIALGFSLSDLTAAWLTGMVSVCNGLGRVIFGTLYDKAGRLTTMSLTTCCQMIGSVLLLLAVKNGSVPLMLAAFVAVSAGYGGAVPTNANFVRSYYGDAHYATNFSIVNFNILISVYVGQYIGSGLYAVTGSYSAMSCAMLTLSAVAMAAAFSIGPERRGDVSESRASSLLIH